MPVWILTAPIFKLKMAARYHVGRDGLQASCEPTYRIVCSCHFLYFLRQYILNYDRLVIFTIAMFVIPRWQPDTISIVIGTKFHMKANATKYM